MTHGTDEARETLRNLHRNRPERRIAGVCAALADHLELPLAVLRAAFLIGALLPSINGLVIALYLGIWFLTPPDYGARSGMDRVLDALRDLFGGDAPSSSSR
ncbi:MAG: PspC domain-containing protein [Deltaproteobacteria bacterium]|nr:PspC domain-containing protein [Deltaproteobacteria bacterium]